MEIENGVASMTQDTEAVPVVDEQPVVVQEVAQTEAVQEAAPVAPVAARVGTSSSWIVMSSDAGWRTMFSYTCVCGIVHKLYASDKAVDLTKIELIKP